MPQPDQAWKGERRGNLPWTFIAFLVLMGSSVLNRSVGRLAGATIVGIFGGLLGWWVTSRLVFALAGLAGGFLLALLIGTGGSGRSGGGRVFRDIGRGGGWGGGGFGGGGGGGGWSGGGGRGGGGGASGRW